MSGPIAAETLQTVSVGTDYPKSVAAAINRRNELWGLTVQGLQLPAPLMSVADRAAVRSLNVQQPQ